MRTQPNILAKADRASHFRLLLPAVLTFTVLLTGPAAAYVGPGIGLGVIGAIAGTVIAVVLAIFGLVWYPFKIMMRKMSGKSAAAPAAETDTPPAAPETAASNADEAPPAP